MIEREKDESGMGVKKGGLYSLKQPKQLKMIILITILVISVAAALFYTWQAVLLILLLFLPLFVYNCALFKNKSLETEKAKLASAMEQLRESERSYAMLLSNLPGMAYRCKDDRNWTMLFVSEGCYDLTGYRPENLLNNRDISYNELIDPEYRQQVYDLWEETLSARTVFRYEYPITTASGKVKWVFEQGRGVYDEQGEVIALEGLMIDISDIKKREAEIRYLNEHDSLTGLYNRRFLDEARKRLDASSQLPLSVIIGDINRLKLINNTLGHAAGDEMIKAAARILERFSREHDLVARTGGDEFTIFLPRTSNKEANQIMKQIETACRDYRHSAKNKACAPRLSLGCATKTFSDQSLNNTLKDAEDNMFRHKLLQQESLYSSIITSMKTTLFEKSQETEEHAQRLIALSRAIGYKMDLIDQELNELELLSTLHDIGKIGISDRVLNKPGKLTEEEWAEMKKHPEIGYRIAMSSLELAPIADYIRCHHERWDGKGYPQGLRGDTIPLLSRILAIVDAYDAMTSDRSYRKALTKEKARLEIERNAGKQFDPELVRIFLEIIAEEIEGEKRTEK